MALKQEMLSVAFIALLLASTLTVAFNMQLIEMGEPVSAGAGGLADTSTAQAEQEAGALSEAPLTEWNKTYGGSGNDYANALVQTSDGGYALAGQTDLFGAKSWDFWLVKTDSVGNEQWNKTYGGTDLEMAYTLVQTTDGGYALAGSSGWQRLELYASSEDRRAMFNTMSFPVRLTDFWLVKTDANGNEQWDRTYGGSDEDVAQALVQTEDGGFALAGYTYSFGAGKTDFWLVKTDANGNEQWNRTYGGEWYDTACDLLQTDDGGYALVGYNGAGGCRFVKTDVDGNVQWDRIYESLDPCCVVEASDKGFAIAGGMGNFQLMKTDPSGNKQWNKTYVRTGDDWAQALVQTMDGGYALAGFKNSYDTGLGGTWLVRTDSAGNALWNETYGGPDDIAFSLIQTADGGYALAGSTYSNATGNADFWFVKIHSEAPQPTPSYPLGKWERIWYVNNAGGVFGSYLGLGPHQSQLSFDDNWDTGTIAYGRSDFIGFVSSRTIHLDAGTWQFSITTDDGALLYIDDGIVLGEWINGAHTYSAQRSFSSAGDHLFRLEWFEDLGSARISFDMAQVSSPTGEITNVAITKKAYKAGEVASFNVEVENRGNIDSDFWVRYTLYHPGEASWPKNTLFRSQAFNAYVGMGQAHTFSLAWTVPEDAAAGIYDLDILLYAGSTNPDQDSSVPSIDKETVDFALIVDQDVSFIQVMEIPTFIGQKRVVYNHIAKEDVAKSGTLTFLYLTTMLQVARMVVDVGTATSNLHKLGNGLKDMFTGAGILKRMAKIRNDGSFDLLHVQILGQGAWCYEDTTPLDIDLGLGFPLKLAMNYPMNILPEQYLAFETPYYSEIQFDWSYAAYLPAMTDFFPYWKFSSGEKWFPCSFYFDNDADVTNNKDNYEKAVLETGRPPYFVYIHVVEDTRYLTIQYWLYYVYNEYHGIIWWKEPHMHDWDSAVYVIFEKPDLQTPKKIGLCSHIFGDTFDWNNIPPIGVQKEGNHVIVYVAEGSHGSHPNIACLPWDEWYPGGDTLGYGNLTNWIIVENCARETTIPEEGDKVFCELYHITRGCVEPAPLSVKEDSIVYWPKDFPGVSEAVWHQEDKWRNTEPPRFTLSVTAHSPVNICVEDSLGRRTGTDSSGNILNEIPDSLYTGPDTEPETVAIMNPTESYTVHVYGTSSGTFSLDSWIYLCDTESIICNSTGITIQEHQTIDYVVPEFPSAPILTALMAFAVFTVTLHHRKRPEKP